jgi:AraC-like DNA-binding protein
VSLGVPWLRDFYRRAETLSPCVALALPLLIPHCNSMPSQTRSFTAAALGVEQDALTDASQPAIVDGVHLHWAFSRSRRFKRLPLDQFGYPYAPGVPENREQVPALEQPSIQHEDEPPPAIMEQLRRIQTYIDAHVSEPDLSPKRIAAAHRMSLRYLYKLFSHAGCAVKKWIRERRLTRCAEALANPAQVHRNVTEIAYAWGFSDLSHFNRMFKRRFGVSPRSYRRRENLEKTS